MSLYLISSLAAFIPICVYILFLRWLDRYEREPFRALVITFILGATISVGLSFFANRVVSIISSLIMTRAGSEYFTASLVAPFVEEVNKGLIVLLFAWLSREFDNVTDGLLYGAVVGLGFAFSENVYYFVNTYRNSGEFAWLQSLYLRGLFTAGVHSCATALFGAAVAYSRHSRWMEKIVSILIGLALAMMVHSFWNSLLTEATLSQDRVLMMVPFLGLPFIFFLLFVLFQISLSQESRMIEEELTAEAKEGILPEAHVKILKSYLARGEAGWCPASVPKEDYVSTATELAFLRQRYWATPPGKRGRLEGELKNLREKIKGLFKVAQDQKGGVASFFLVLFVFIGFLGGLIYAGFHVWQGMLNRFPATEVGKTYLTHHPQVKERVGENLSFHSFLFGTFHYGETGGDGNLEIEMKGDKGSATASLSFVNGYRGQPWKIQSAYLALEGEEKFQIDSPAQWLTNANSLINARQVEGAELLCALIQQAVPDDERGVYCNAEVSRARGDLDQFIELRKSLADKNPDYYRHQSQLGDAYYQLGEWEKSIEYYNRSWELFPDPLLAVDIGGIYLDQKKDEEGFSWLEKARSKEIVSSRLEYNYGKYYLNRGEYPRALASFSKAQELDSLDPYPCFGLAITHWRQGEEREAVYFFEQGLARAPATSLHQRKNLVDLLIEMEYFDDAIYHVWKVIDYHPQEVEAYVVLSKLLQRNGRTGESTQVMNKALELDPQRAQEASRSFDYLRSL